MAVRAARLQVPPSVHPPEDFKAWSQNLGHEKVLTTFISYGSVGTRRQGEIIRDLGTRPDPDALSESLAEQIAAAVERRITKK